MANAGANQHANRWCAADGGLCVDRRLRRQRRPTGEHADAQCNRHPHSYDHVDVHRNADVDALSEPFVDNDPNANAVADQHAGARGD